jgi:hypothetical protein
MNRMRCSAAVLLAALVAACSERGASEVATPIQLAFSGTAAPSSYLISYEQDIGWGSADLERRYGARIGLAGSGMTEGGVRLSARLDSLGIAQSTPHGRVAQDTRHLVGSEFDLVVATHGGPPTYSAGAPLYEMPGQLEGELAIQRLLDFGFPVLAQGLATPGAAWGVAGAAPYVAAHMHATATTTTDYVFLGHETIDGVDVVRIEGRMTGRVHAPEHDRYGTPTSFEGTIEGEFTWLFDPAEGSLYSMTGTTNSQGTMTAGGNESPIRQETRVRIER